MALSRSVYGRELEMRASRCGLSSLWRILGLLPHCLKDVFSLQPLTLDGAPGVLVKGIFSGRRGRQ